MSHRNHRKPSASFTERLLKAADEALKKAHKLKPSKDKNDLLEKAASLKPNSN